MAKGKKEIKKTPSPSWIPVHFETEPHSQLTRDRPLQLCSSASRRRRPSAPPESQSQLAFLLIPSQLASVTVSLLRCSCRFRLLPVDFVAVLCSSRRFSRSLAQVKSSSPIHISLFMKLRFVMKFDFDFLSNYMSVQIMFCLIFICHKHTILSD